MVAVIALIQCSISDPLKELVNQSHSLNVLIDSLGIDDKNLSIHIDKSNYNLSVIHDGNVLKQYHVVFGGNPIDDKLMEEIGIAHV